MPRIPKPDIYHTQAPGLSTESFPKTLVSETHGPWLRQLWLYQPLCHTLQYPRAIIDDILSRQLSGGQEGLSCI
jgi:hypothetical protein